MKMSTRGRYGLRAMLELARCFGEAPVLMATLAEREGLSRKYLHALLTELKSAGLVRSVRGAAGGFVLSREPGEIRLSEVLRALEGSLSLVHCVDDEHLCHRAEQCAARRVWQDLSAAIENVVDNVTLGELVAPRESACREPGAPERAVPEQRRPRRKAGHPKALAESSRSRHGGSRNRRAEADRV